MRLNYIITTLAFAVTMPATMHGQTGQGNYTLLQSAVTSAENYLAGLDPDNYPPSALAEYQDAINIANDMITMGTASQSAINSCRTALTTARTKLNSTRGKKFDTSSISGGYDADRGFRHPGGLHTEADFSRIRQQLADGNEKVSAAYKVLKAAEYSQATCPTWPVETIVRGGGNGENYINAARGATIAYQNALRWHIDGTKANAENAVKTLMAWANTTKVVTGNSDAALAYGLYGYEFAQAAELMRDYEGWSREDFAKFQRWMLDVWYPGCIGFLRGRNGTWENAGKWWQAPGHYWSNWGLCNALAVLSIGVLCDDVFIYNQGLSFIKYDQCETFTDPRTSDPILNDGLTEFWGNLIVTTTTSPLETGAYGKLGQMNESGRDTGHASMAAGLAVDIAHQIYNQGDDLFAFMDHRLAAGIEYIAAQTQSVANLPWTNYHYANNGFYYTDSRSWLMTGPALGAQMRPYWGTVIGHYEGVKGVSMPFSHRAYEEMGIDGGGLGGTSGGYDHLGYSVLMNTRDGLAPANKVPTELSGKMKYNGRTVSGNELGGLKNTFSYIANQGFTPGTEVTLMPQLPEGEEDTGLWRWDSGETTRDITVTTNASHVYRVTYTNANGIESEQAFTIAVQGDCQASRVIPYINDTETLSATVEYGSEVTLRCNCPSGWGSILWDNGQTDYTITIPAITTSRDVRAIFTNQGGRQTMVTFHINVQKLVPSIKVGNTTHEGVSTTTVKEGTDVTLYSKPATLLEGGKYLWTIDGSEAGDSSALQLTAMSQSMFPTLTYYTNDTTIATLQYELLVYPRNDILIDEADYLIRHRATGTYLTNTAGADAQPSLLPAITDTNGNTSPTQIWHISRNNSARYDIMSVADSLYLNASGQLITRTFRTQRIAMASGTDFVQFYNSSNTYWLPNADGTITFGGTDQLSDFPFQLIRTDKADGISTIKNQTPATGKSIYNIAGQRIGHLQRGLNIVNGKKVLVK